MADSIEQKTVRMPCLECGGWPKNHRVVRDFSRSWSDDEGDTIAVTEYQICQCLGCDQVGFREVSTTADDFDDNGERTETVKIYPEAVRVELRPVDAKEFPDTVSRIYAETISAFNAGALTLAGGGLRAIVEAICIDRQVAGRNLSEKINDLAVKGLLAKPQADLLHEERYIGNAALHELVPPSKQEIKDGLKIIEGLMSTIYVLPKHAEKLRLSRQKRSP
jgi:hypothetical protein